jgi:SAM-dependent methyltransferase
MTENRLKVIESMEEYRRILQPDNKRWDILEIGIDGDEFPSGNHKYFGQGNNFKTLDFLPRLNPDIVVDICDNDLPSESWDLIICSQVLEHLFEPMKAVSQIYRLLKPGGYAILDSPWDYPYHGLPDYDDYWRISDKAMAQMVKSAGFEIIVCKINNPLTTALCQKS